jgi:hypothetical protein
VTSPAPGGTGPAGPYLYNSTYFATPETAAIVKTIVESGCNLKPGSCKVVEVNAITPLGPFKQNQPNQMIQMPDGSQHYAGRIAFEFQAWPSIETINAELTQELGMPFTFVPPPKPTDPVAGVELMVAPIGGTVTQADGTTWKRES